MGQTAWVISAYTSPTQPTCNQFKVCAGSPLKDISTESEQDSEIEELEL